MSKMNGIKSFAIDRAYDYIEHNPEQNAVKLLDMVDWFAGDGENSFPKQREAFRKALTDKESNWYQLIMHVLKDMDSGVVKKFFSNFILNANLVGWKRQEEIRQKYNCNAPWAILLDPTSACNLHCTGCWAGEYGHQLNLSFDEIDSIITQGKDLGTYFYIYTGGEPLIRKKDIIRLCEKHSDCIFLSFTNATLIDEDFADEMLRVKNFIPAISVEGDRKSHDSRRGEGSFDKVVAAMNLLKEKRLPFGISCCYTSQNLDAISSEAYFDQMVDWGALFVWYFHYMPVGNDASTELLPSPEQREFMYHQIRKFRREKAIFAMDFQNDGQYVGVCIAGGRRYFHINANGDVDPCVFIHYSDSNIREKTLLECLTSGLFRAYHDGQPFNENHLRPCPMLENPDKLREMASCAGVHSTDLMSPESAEHLCAKCDHYAKNWTPTAEKLWNAQK